jgi:DNA recombination protein RmuC
MDISTLILIGLALLVGVTIGACAAWLTAGVLARGREAGIGAERDLLARRVADLEAATADDRELAATLSPLTTTLERVEQQVRTLERDRVEQYARLDAHLVAVQAGSDALRSQAAALAGALRSPTARGAWGEVQLRRVVELAGMVARVDYTPQATGRTPEGIGVRPDMVVHLPGGRHVVVDAKTPLAAFLEASEAAHDADRQSAAAAAHARALRAHVEGLAAKEYWTAFQPAPEIVVCFVPGEAFLAAACTADPSLLEHAMGRRVVLATPTTLLALLRTVALSWQGEALTGNAKQLLEIGRELHTRLGALGERTGKLGKTLQRAVDDYNAMVGTLERRVLVTARKIRDMELADADLAGAEPLESTVRLLTAPELRLELADPADGSASAGSADLTITDDDLCLPEAGEGGKALAG